MIKSIYYYAITKLSLIFFSFYSVHLLTNYLSLSEYGQLDLFLVTISLIGIALNLGISSAINRELNLFDRDIGDVFTNSLLFFIKAVLISFLIYFINKQFCFVDSHYLIILLIISLINVLIGYFTSIIRATNKSKLFFITNLIQQVIYVTLLYFNKDRLSVEIVLYIILSYSVVTLGFYCIYFRKNLIGKFNKEIYKSLSYYGLPLVLGGFAEFIFNSSDKYMINYFLDKESVALYSLNYKIGAMLMMAVGIFQMIWPRYMYRIYKNHKNYNELYRIIFNIYAFIIMNLALFLVVWRKYIILILSNNNYLAANNIVIIIASGIIFYGFHYIVNAGIHISGKSHIMTSIIIVAGIINIGLNYVFIPIYGYEAAAFTTIISMFFIFGSVWYFANRLVPITYDFKKIFLVYMIYCLIAGMFYFYEFSILEGILFSIIFLVVSGGVLLNKQDFQVVKVLNDE